MTRAAHTLLEMIVVVGICLVLFSGTLVVWNSGERASRVGSSTAALQSAMMLTEVVYREISQLGIDNDRREPLLLNNGSLSFYRVRFQGPQMRLSPIKLSRVKTPRGNWVLKRFEIGPGGQAVTRTYGNAPCTEFTFSQIIDPAFKTRYLRLFMRVLEGDLPKGPARRDPFAHSAIMRVPLPSQVGNPALAPVMRIVPDADLFPLD